MKHGAVFLVLYLVYTFCTVYKKYVHRYMPVICHLWRAVWYADYLTLKLKPWGCFFMHGYYSDSVLFFSTIKWVTCFLFMFLFSEWNQIFVWSASLETYILHIIYHNSSFFWQTILVKINRFLLAWLSLRKNRGIATVAALLLLLSKKN